MISNNDETIEIIQNIREIISQLLHKTWNESIIMWNQFARMQNWVQLYLQHMDLKYFILQ